MIAHTGPPTRPPMRAGPVPAGRWSAVGRQAVTVRLPVMLPWMLQWYVNVPAASSVI